MFLGIPHKLCATTILLPLSLGFAKTYETATIESYENDHGLRIEGEAVDPANKFALGAEDVKDGTKRLNLNYKLDSPESQVVVSKPFELRVRVYRLSVQVLGDGKGAQIGFLLRDSSGNRIRAPLGMVTFTGWKTLETRYSSPDSVAAKTPFQNDIEKSTWFFQMPRMSYPFVLEGIYLRSQRPVEGNLAFDDLSIMGRFEPEQLVEVKLKPKNGVPYFWGQQDKPVIGLELSAPGTMTAKANLQVTLKDSREKILSTPFNEPVEVESGKVTTKAIPLDLTQYGAYYLECAYGTAVIHKSFCWMPAKAKFNSAGRLGVTVDDPGIGEDIPLFLEAAKWMGATMVRFRFMWDEIEKSPGEYVFPKRYDLAIESCLRLGLQPLVVVGDLNQHYESGKFPISDEAVKAFCDYGMGMARRYKGKVKHWEIFNASNSTRFNLQSAKPYMKLLDQIYPLMKAEDPGSVIVGGSIYGIPFSYIEDMMGTYLGDGMDAFSVQPTYYSSSNFYLEYYFQSYLSRLDENLKAYGAGDLKVWLTSIWNHRAFKRSNAGGASSWDKYGDYLAASKFCRMALAATPYDFCGSSFINSLTDGPQQQQSYLNALIDSDGSPTAGYASFNTMSRMIGDKNFLSDLPIQNSGAQGSNAYPPFAYLYGNEQEKVLAAWTRNGYFAYHFKTDTENVILTDLMGNETSVKTWNGLVSLRFSDEPAFVKGFGEIEIGTPLFDLKAPESTPAGLPIEMELSVVEGFPNEGFDLELPPGWQSEWIQASTLKLTPPESVSFGTFSITLKPKNFPGMSNVTTVSLTDGTTLALSAADNETLTVTVSNPLPIVRQAKVQVTLIAPGVSREILSDQISIPAAGSVVKQFQAIAEHPKGYSQARIQARMNTGRGSSDRSEVFYVGNTPCYQMSKVVVDAKLDEWQELRPAILDQKYQYNEERSPDWGSTEDLSARFWTGWDSEHFFVAAEVMDEAHSNSYSGRYLSYGDSLRFTVAGKQMASDFGVAKLDSGILNIFEFYPSGTEGPEDLEAKIVRSGNKTFYEIAVTWPRLKVALEDRESMRFSLLVIDADTQKVEGVMEWCNWPGRSMSMRAEHHNPMIWLKGK